MMIDFSGKTILVIGASSGIGEETARVLAKNGGDVILVARREEKLINICKSIGAKAAYYTADISIIDDIDELFNRITSEHGPVDGMAYVAGIGEDIPLKNLKYEKILKIFQTNYFGFVESVRQITKRGRYNNEMRIVAVSSVSSILGEKAYTAYAGSKGAMDASLRCMAKELSRKGICINSVAPSMVKTDMYEGFITEYGEDSIANIKTMNRQYLGLAETKDVANAITFLLSSMARFITGITLPVDGGFTTSC